jgi:hypothetical protein
MIVISFASQLEPEGCLAEIRLHTLTFHIGLAEIECRFTASPLVGFFENLQTSRILLGLKKSFSPENKILRRRSGRGPLGRRYFRGSGRDLSSSRQRFLLLGIRRGNACGRGNSGIF